MLGLTNPRAAPVGWSVLSEPNQEAGWGVVFPSPFFSMVLSRDSIRLPWVSGGFLERIPGKNGHGR